MGFIKWIKEVLDIEDSIQDSELENTAELHESAELPMTDEEKQLVAVIASCIVGRNKPDIQLHIQKIRRIG